MLIVFYNYFFFWFLTLWSCSFAIFLPCSLITVNSSFDFVVFCSNIYQILFTYFLAFCHPFMRLIFQDFSLFVIICLLLFEVSICVSLFAFRFSLLV